MINKELLANVGMSYLKVVFRVSKEGNPYLKAFNQLMNLILGFGLVLKLT